VLGPSPFAAAEPINIKLLYIGDPGGSAYIGAQQGLSEANLQGRFLGQTYVMESASLAEIASADNDAMAVLVDSTAADLRALSAKMPGVAIYNLTSDDDDLRSACLPNLLHVAPSARMKADGRAQWRNAHPDDRVEVSAWHSDFKKFAARELNNRYSKANGRSMDDNAWAGWAAVKMISDTVAREKTTEPSALLAYMRNELRFDGQKGDELVFRSTGQLSQLLLVSDATGKLLGEVPLRPHGLDSLGLTDCPK
jgi:hypothetical protein